MSEILLFKNGYFQLKTMKFGHTSLFRGTPSHLTDLPAAGRDVGTNLVAATSVSPSTANINLRWQDCTMFSSPLENVIQHYHFCRQLFHYSVFKELFSKS
jgi:hypothetical protein